MAALGGWRLEGHDFEANLRGTQQVQGQPKMHQKTLFYKKKILGVVAQADNPSCGEVYNPS